MNKKFRRYSFYAMGEIALIVVGIFIALEIDNWNSDRQEEAALDNYLRSIMGNVRNDLAEIQRLRDLRGKALLSFGQIPFLRDAPQVTTEALYFYNSVKELTTLNAQFIPNTGGFDALKSSGTLSRLQGRDIENLLFRYYDAVDRVQRLERDLQIAQTTYASRESPKLPESVEYYALVDPLALPPNRFEELQPFYRSFLQGTAFAQDMQVVELLTNSIAPIVHEYDKLLELGQYFVTMIEKDADTFTPAIMNMLQRLDNIERGVGNPIVVANGRISDGSYLMGMVSQSDIYGPSSQVHAAFDYRSAQYSDDALHLSYYGNEPWGVIWFGARSSLSSLYSRNLADFSRYDQLVLELKGAFGGEVVLVNLKDKDDPDDGSQTNVELVLTDDWQTYNFDLSEFNNADLKTLIALSFLIPREEPVAFAIRTARFVESSALE